MLTWKLKFLQFGRLTRPKHHHNTQQQKNQLRHCICERNWIFESVLLRYIRCRFIETRGQHSMTHDNRGKRDFLHTTRVIPRFAIFLLLIWYFGFSQSAKARKKRFIFKAVLFKYIVRINKLIVVVVYSSCAINTAREIKNNVLTATVSADEVSASCKSKNEHNDFLLLLFLFWLHYSQLCSTDQ